MMRFLPELPADGTVLCLGAHSDDIEIGCGGFLMKLRESKPSLHFKWIVFSGDETRERETRTAAAEMLPGARLTHVVHKFRGSYFPSQVVAIKDVIEQLKRDTVPHLILTHYLWDRHQDHRVLAELAWNTWRNHCILEYEIPKYDGDLAQPGVFCPLDEATVQRKISVLLSSFASQRDHQWFDADLFRGHMRLRGVECNSPTRFAEAFHARKIVL